MDEQTINMALAVIVFGCVGLGLLIMALGPILSFFDGLAERGAESAANHRRRREEMREAIHRKRLETVRSYGEDEVDIVSAGPGTEISRTGTPTDTYQSNSMPPTPNLTERDNLTTLALLKKADGSWLLSANKVHDLVGGGRNEVLEKVRRAREGEPTNDDELITPYAGRRTRASYYPDAPELEYKDVPA